MTSSRHGRNLHCSEARPKKKYSMALSPMNLKAAEARTSKPAGPQEDPQPDNDDSYILVKAAMTSKNTIKLLL